MAIGWILTMRYDKDAVSATTASDQISSPMRSSDDSSTAIDFQEKFCAACNNKGDSLRRCSACKTVWYCGMPCQKTHRKVHAKECKRIEKELAQCNKEATNSDDEEGNNNIECAATTGKAEKSEPGLWDNPPPGEDCDICMLVLPYDPRLNYYQYCCGKNVCGGCHEEHGRVIEVINSKNKDKEKPLVEKSCPYCRARPVTTDEEVVECLHERIDRGDAKAMYELALYYRDGSSGLKKKHAKALKLLHRAADLGCLNACGLLGQCYMLGTLGCKVDETKAREYWEKAAKGGNTQARHDLGTYEHSRGHTDLAVRHWRIAACSGNHLSSKELIAYCRRGIISKAELEEILRTKHEACQEMRSDGRDRFAAAKQAAGEYDKNDGFTQDA